MLDLTQIREQLPAVARSAYFNTGSNGPLPQVAAQAMTAAAERELTAGRIGQDAAHFIAGEKRRLRQSFAQLLHAPSASIALTHSTTEGINLALWGLRWQEGDEIITTNLEHPGLTVPLALLRQRFGVVVRFLDTGLGHADRLLAALARAFTPRTRLVALSHVSYASGALFPLAAIVELARQRDAWVLADAAQSAGAIPVDVTALGVDFYACSGQKWLCGPDGSGALYVHPDRFDDLLPSFGGYTTVAAQDHRGWIVPHNGAMRYEGVTHYGPAIAGMNAALAWLCDDIGFDAIHERIAALAQTARSLLLQIPGVTLLTPAGQQAGLVNFDIVGWSPQAQAALNAAVNQAGYVIRGIPHAPFGLRISTGFFNTTAELEGLAAELEQRLAQGPDALPVPPAALHLPSRYVKPSA